MAEKYIYKMSMELSQFEEALQNAQEIPDIKNALGNKADAEHGHTIDDIEEFPDKMPPTSHAASHKTGGDDEITPDDIGAVPTTRKVNNKALTSDITLGATDIGMVEGTNYCGIDPYNPGKINPERASAPMRLYNTNVTLSLADAGALVYCYGSDLIVTIPTYASVAFPIGTEIEIMRGDNYTVTIAAAAGVNLYCSESARTIAKTFNSVCLKKTNENDWILQGALE